MKYTFLNLRYMTGGSYFLATIVFLFIISTACVVCAENNKSIVITAIKNEHTHAMAKEVVREAYRKIGYSVRFDFFPSTRSLEMANRGESDGDVARIEGTEKEFPGLVPIPVPVIWFDGVVFTKNVAEKIKDWKDLKGFRIGIIRGVRYSKIGTKGLSPLFAEDMTHLFKLLDEGMIQVAIAVLRTGEIEIEQHFQNSSIHVVGEPLFSAPLYHFVHKKNRHIVSKLTEVLQEMEQDGETKKIIESAFQTLRNNNSKY